MNHTTGKYGLVDGENAAVQLQTDVTMMAKLGAAADIAMAQSIKAHLLYSLILKNTVKWCIIIK